jgi:hypothetical protein
MEVGLALWSLFVWATRIRNVADAGGGAVDLAVPVGLTVLAVGTLVDRRRLGPVLAAATVAVWGVRLPFVLVHAHPAGFKVVHTVLAAISLGLAGAVLRSRWTPRRTARLPVGG